MTATTTTTTTTGYNKAQLAAVLSALDDQPRNPANREAALNAIGKSAERLGLTAAEVLAAAPGLLDGRLSAAAWRAELRDLADPTLALARAHRAAVVPAAPEERGEAVDDGADAAAADDGRPEQAGAPRDGAAPAAAAEGGSTGAALDATPDAAAEAGDADAVPGGAAPTARPPRAGTKQALLIDLLRRPEGATIDELVAATGWQRHTVRGAISGALKKKLGLAVASERAEGRGRVYRLAAPPAT